MQILNKYTVCQYQRNRLLKFRVQDEIKSRLPIAVISIVCAGLQQEQRTGRQL
jgi:hypothetical protein